MKNQKDLSLQKREILIKNIIMQNEIGLIYCTYGKNVTVFLFNLYSIYILYEHK